jgi:hypothetical protein
LSRIETQTAVPHQIIRVVGPKPISYREMLVQYRRAMNLSPAMFIRIPMPVMHISASLAHHLPQKVFAPETLQMLEQGNVADSLGFTQLLGQTPRGADDWFTNQHTQTLAAAAITNWSQLLFRLMLAFLWISTGIISLWVYPREDSLRMLAQVGINGESASIVLYLASSIDMLLGIATLSRPHRNLWLFQSVLILSYSFIIAVYLPEFLIHPFAPVLKNLPILAILFVLVASEKRATN